MQVPSVDGILTEAQILASAEGIAQWQLPNGMIPWIPGGHADPWNHVEAAMALATCGLVPEAELAYDWLASIQRPDGSWHNYYVEGGIEDAKFDANCIAYIATGVWHHWLVTGDRDFLDGYWGVVEPAIEFVLELQTKRGEVIWARRPDGTPWSYALLTGSSSINHSLRCASLIADLMGTSRPHWAEARDRLIGVIAEQPDAFEPKDRWAMDWYYPVLTGAIVGEAAAQHLADRWEQFIMEGKGCRCVYDRPWVTAAETCECVIAHLAAGERSKAVRLFENAQTLRDDADGRYYTGLVYPELIHFPELEKSTYTAAAVILAADALQGANPTSNLFTDYP
ncbi:MAG: prenyltransferase [Acidimicrobiales bacterium]